MSGNQQSEFDRILIGGREQRHCPGSVRRAPATRSWVDMNGYADAPSDGIAAMLALAETEE